MTTSWLTTSWAASYPGAPELALLLAAHALADFVFQTKTMVENKGTSFGWFCLHIGIVAATTAVLLLPFGHGTLWLSVLFIAGSHGVIDMVKTRVRPMLPPRNTLLVFAVDQALHLLSLWVAFRLLMLSPRALGLTLDLAGYTLVAQGALLVAAYAFVGNGGSAIVANVLGRYYLTASADPADQERSAQMGHMIGVLERVTILTLVLLDQWGALGLILAAKSIARFKDLDQRSFSEYYLIGTLTSLLAAIATGLVAKSLL